MADLKIKGEALDELHHTFTTIAKRMARAGRSMKGADSESVGAWMLIRKVQDFADEWDYGIEQLGKHADGAAQMLRKIAKDFDGLERELEAALQPKGS
ncbi:hypothetical protein DMB38_19075 [Streptomyces sp. WAC 06738]|uniref:hypothetical protein n=1 Tax=Streptomyces sp. WAC 06738 TaxID=2203210 RepID=UPI000F7212F4|nr:hypothetical protein [Streptomyces sp. WAC 06738]AZM47612.1 hypothetical protein DMB38_19075 [Streptomyces sp. WAC 06738]